MREERITSHDSIAISRSWFVGTWHGKKKKTKTTVPKTREKEERSPNRIDNPFPAVEKWTGRGCGCRWTPISIYMLAKRPTACEKRSKSLFRIAGMNIYDRTSGHDDERQRERDRESQNCEEERRCMAKSGCSGFRTRVQWRMKKSIEVSKEYSNLYNNINSLMFSHWKYILLKCRIMGDVCLCFSVINNNEVL